MISAHPRMFLALAVALAVAVAAALVSLNVAASSGSLSAFGSAFSAASPRVLLAPFPSGQTWYVCQGYGTGSHAGRADLDLVFSKSDAGTTGCNTGAKSSSGKEVLSPAAGEVSTRWKDDSTGSICVNFDSGGSMMFSHLEGYPKGGTRLQPGSKLGKVAPPVTGQTKPKNNNVAHLHLTAFSAKDCSGSKVPFSAAASMRFTCARDMTDDNKVNQWFKEAVWACPTGELGGVNMQGACDRQYPNQGRVAKVMNANDAYSWRCVAKSGDQKSIDVVTECRFQFASTATAKAKDSRNPYSWVCLR